MKHLRNSSAAELSCPFEFTAFELLFEQAYIFYGTFNILVVGAQKGANVVDERQPRKDSQSLVHAASPVVPFDIV